MNKELKSITNSSNSNLSISPSGNLASFSPNSRRKRKVLNTNDRENLPQVLTEAWEYDISHFLPSGYWSVFWVVVTTITFYRMDVLLRMKNFESWNLLKWSSYFAGITAVIGIYFVGYCTYLRKVPAAKWDEIAFSKSLFLIATISLAACILLFFFSLYPVFGWNSIWIIFLLFTTVISFLSFWP